MHCPQFLHPIKVSQQCNCAPWGSQRLFQHPYLLSGGMHPRQVSTVVAWSVKPLFLQDCRQVVGRILVCNPKKIVACRPVIFWFFVYIYIIRERKRAREREKKGVCAMKQFTLVLLDVSVITAQWAHLNVLLLQSIVTAGVDMIVSDPVIIFIEAVQVYGSACTCGCACVYIHNWILCPWNASVKHWRFRDAFNRIMISLAALHFAHISGWWKEAKV